MPSEITEGTNRIPEKGLPQKTIIQELETKLERDLVYSSEKILCSMCTNPHSFAKQIYRKYLEKNLGDPSLFPSSVELKQETISMSG
jgi:tyrosine decarboxylase/aspartate 1-decarboxylase